MAGFRYPNESDEYRARRDELLEKEKELRALGVAVAKQRHELPLGGRLKEDYLFQQVGAGGEVREVPFEELFGDHSTLLLYSMMFGAEWDAPCPSCTSLVDVFNTSYFPLSHHCAMAVIAAAEARQLHDWAQTRGWTSIPLYSGANNGYLIDYFARDDGDDPSLVAMMNCFRRTPEGIFHTWGSELVNHPMENGHPRHVDSVWPFWNLLDMTPDGRGEIMVPTQDFEHAYFSAHVFPGSS